jgi:hypothetical protein
MSLGLTQFVRLTGARLDQFAAARDRLAPLTDQPEPRPGPARGRVGAARDFAAADPTWPYFTTLCRRLSLRTRRVPYRIVETGGAAGSLARGSNVDRRSRY